MEQQDLGKTSLGISPQVAAVLSYVLGFVGGIIIYLIEKENKFVRFHAMQSIIVFGSLALINIINVTVLGVVFPWSIRGIISMVDTFAALILWIVLVIKAGQGEYFKVFIAGDIAEQKTQSL